MTTRAQKALSDLESHRAVACVFLLKNDKVMIHLNPGWWHQPNDLDAYTCFRASSTDEALSMLADDDLIIQLEGAES